MRHILRAEARPATWEEMVGTEQMALRDAITMLAEAVERVPALGVSEGTDWLIEDRRSQAAFISGSRGTGKTTVFLSLLRCCNPLEKRKETITDDLGIVSKLVPLVRERLVWLRPLDMDAVSESSNLFAAMVTRIEDACEQFLSPHTGDRCEPTRRGVLDLEAPDPLDDLRSLSANIAIGWDQDLNQRRPHVNPDIFAAEAMRIERAGLTLVSGLNRVLGKLACALHRTGKVENPLFVLPVDDFDMNPVACLGLLRMLRMLWLPRLFFLVLGDLDVVDLLLDLKMSDDIARVGASAVQARTLPVSRKDVARVSGELAAHAFRKLIPLPQRMTLTVSSIRESLNWRPLNSDAQVPRLHQLLSRLKLLPNNTDATGSRLSENHESSERPLVGKNLDNLYELLVPAYKAVEMDGTTQRLKDVTRDTNFYSAIDLFETPIRRVADFWHAIQRIDETKKAEEEVTTKAALETVGNDPLKAAQLKSLLASNRQEFVRQKLDWLRWIVSQQCLQAVLEEPGISEQDRHEIFESLKPRPSHDWNLRTLPIQVSTSSAVVVDAALQPPARSKGTASHSFSQITSWRMTAGRGNGDVSKPDIPFSKSTTGMEILFHDLVYEAPWQAGRGSLLWNREDVTRDWAITEWTEGDASVVLQWPVIPCSTFWTLDQFIFSWNNSLTRFHDEPIRPVGAALEWISAGTQALPQLGDEPDSWRQVTLAPSWPRVSDHLNHLAGHAWGSTYLANLRREWLIRVACLFLPEFGVPDLKIESLELDQRACDLKAFWAEHKDTINTRRQRYNSAISEMRMAGLARKLMDAPAPILDLDRSAMVTPLPQQPASTEQQQQPAAPNAQPPRRTNAKKQSPKSARPKVQSQTPTGAKKKSPKSARPKAQSQTPTGGKKKSPKSPESVQRRRAK